MVAACDSCLKKGLARAAQLLSSDPLEKNQPDRSWLHALMTIFPSNGAASLLLFAILRERFSACGDRPYPTIKARRVSQTFAASCTSRADTSFTAQTFALGCGL